MELSWLMRIRIAASLAIGIILLGLLPWSLVKLPQKNSVVLLLDKA
jgi:hypothetical protein